MIVFLQTQSSVFILKITEHLFYACLKTLSLALSEFPDDSKFLPDLSLRMNQSTLDSQVHWTNRPKCLAYKTVTANHYSKNIYCWKTAINAMKIIFCKFEREQVANCIDFDRGRNVSLWPGWVGPPCQYFSRS